MFIPRAPEPVKAPEPCSHTLLPSPPAFGGSIQAYGAE